MRNINRHFFSGKLALSLIVQSFVVITLPNNMLQT